jgi:ribosome-binding protein aMBF1 (putative translation factor)
MNSVTTWNDAIGGMSEGEQLITMAVAVLQNRIDTLPEDDRNELVELVMEWPKAKTAEESRSIWVAMREILAQKPMTARRLSLPNEISDTGKAKKWAERVGSRIRQLRTERGWTQTELAEKAGLPQPHVCRIERAEYTATYKTLEKIAKAFGVEIEQINPSND